MKKALKYFLRCILFDHKPGVYVKQITCPVLLQFLMKDVRVSAQQQEDIFENITAPKQPVLYQNSSQESFCKKQNAKWLAPASAFLQ